MIGLSHHQVQSGVVGTIIDAVQYRQTMIALPIADAGRRLRDIDRYCLKPGMDAAEKN